MLLDFEQPKAMQNAIVDPNEGRFDFGKPYTIKLDNETEWAFTREHVLEVLKHAVEADGFGGVESVCSKEGERAVKYPHKFYNNEDFDFALYKEGQLHEYPILVPDPTGKISFFGRKPRSRDPYKYRVVYTINNGVGILQGESKSGKAPEIPWQKGQKQKGQEQKDQEQKGQEQKKSSDFVISPQFRKGWNPLTGAVESATKIVMTGKLSNSTWETPLKKQNNDSKKSS
ncbi:hypothetical protein RHS03_00761, partial [Rhizoctonia solani]